MFRFDASIRVLDEVTSLFDEIAATPMRPDCFGERVEIAATVAFLAWRTAYLLNLEMEAQEWIRISDSLAIENTVERERLEAFLYLPGAAGKSGQLCRAFLGTSLDVYLSLSILRSDRLRKPVSALRAAERIYQWTETGAIVAKADEVEFFAADSATLVAAIYRMLGRQEFRGWLSLARKHLRRMKCPGPMRTKLHILSFLRQRDQHRFRYSVPGLRLLVSNSLRWGNYRDALTCRFAVAIASQLRGDLNGALASLEALVEETTNTEYQSLHALSLCHLADIRAAKGDPETAIRIQARGLEIGLESGDQLSLGSMFLVVGAGRKDLSDHVGAMACFETALMHYRSIGAGYWLGYALLIVAEAQIEVRRYQEALESIRAAIPIVQREKMLVEGVHAMSLLKEITCHLGREAVRKVLKDVQESL
jgi:tetratricopeptide (TPR) repeat protein